MIFIKPYFHTQHRPYPRVITLMNEKELLVIIKTSLFLSEDILFDITKPLADFPEYDSLTFLRIVERLENKLKTRLDIEAMIKAKTTQDLLELVQKGVGIGG